MNLIEACRDGYVARVQELLKNGEDPAGEDNLCLRYASLFGNTKIVEILLLDGRADPTADYNYAIKIASLHGYTDLVKLLLQDERVDPTAGDNHPIRVASKRGHIKVVEILLKDGRVDPTDRNELAIQNADTEEIKEMLIKYKYRVDGKEYCKMKESLEK
jgi:ankyrin repeat protein